MILPGTLVQYVANLNPLLRANGVYTVKSWSPGTHWTFCGVHNARDCGQSFLLLCEADPVPRGEISFRGRPSNGFFSSCGFRILAPPITEADRLEMSAPDDGGAKQPSTREPKIKVRGVRP